MYVYMRNKSSLRTLIYIIIYTPILKNKLTTWTNKHYMYFITLDENAFQTPLFLAKNKTKSNMGKLTNIWTTLGVERYYKKLTD